MQKLFNSDCGTKHSRRRTFIQRLLLAILLSAPILAHSASTQAIGAFPQISGGFEDQTPGTLPTAASITSGSTSSTWTVQTSSGTATAWDNGGRSGPGYVTFGATAARRLQSPTTAMGAVANNRPHVFQFFYRTAGPIGANNGQAALSTDGTGALGTYASLSLSGTTNTWKKASQLVTSSSVSPKYGLAVLRFSAGSGIDIDLDDFVVYPGSTTDDTPPDPPAATTIANTGPGELTLSWDAPASGVDGGGYLVVRGTNDPVQPPNQNGIYAVGQTIAPSPSAGVVVFIGTNSTFRDLGLTDGRPYFYRLYAVDKAFNYSSPVGASGTPGDCVSPAAATLVAEPGTNMCSGIPLTLRANASGGVTPYTYEWRRNGNAIPGAASSALLVTDPTDGDELVCAVRSACGAAPALTPMAKLSVRPVLAPALSITANPGTTLCPGTAVTLLAAATGAGTNPAFEWKRNGIVVIPSGPTGTNTSELTLNSPADLDLIECSIVASDPCASPQTAAAPPLTVHLKPIVTPQLTIAASPGTNLCAGLAVTFIATPSNAGLDPSFQWLVNGLAIAGATNSAFTIATPTNGTTVTCYLTPSPEICSATPTATANPVVLQVRPIHTATLTLAASPGTQLCEGQLLTLIAMAENAGAAPAFQWTKNGASFGLNSSSCTDPAPRDGDRFACRLIPSVDCATPPTIDAGPILVSVNAFSTAAHPAVVYSENFGVPSGATDFTNYTGWQNHAPITYATTTATDVRATSASAGYAQASGSGNVYMGSASSMFRDFTVSGINTRHFANLCVQFAIRIDNVLGPVTLEAAADGTNWTALSFSAPVATATWYWATANGNVPATSNLCLRFTKSNNAQVRIDDLTITGLRMTPAIPQITASGPATIRPGQTLTLTASPGQFWTWSTGQTNESIIVQPFTNTAYAVSITDLRGCTGSASLAISVSGGPLLVAGPTLDLATFELVARFAASPAQMCTIESAPAPDGPWSLLRTQPADPAGVLELRVSTTGGQQRFYRLR